MDSYTKALFKEYKIGQKFNMLKKRPYLIYEWELNQTIINLLLEYGQLFIDDRKTRAFELANYNPNYPYPKEYENDWLSYWLSKDSHYKDALNVLELVMDYDNNILNPPNKIVFNFTEEQIKSLYNELIKPIDKNSPTGLIKNDWESFYQFMRNEMPKNKIKWLSQSSKNNNPNKKALVELFLIGHETNNPINNKPFIHIPNKNDADIEQAASQRIIRKFLNELIKETFLFRDTTNPDKWVSSEIKADKYPSPKTINKGTSIPYSDYYKIVYPDIFDKLKPPNTK